ncbi:hypothetical protein ACJMK2_033039 [Sinanodonta woodiana]|uniref:Mab-21-like HhH/H2TH-like domain-containing protein n=1 Tax=Sinanodonta woodiana TaxID=1069815 RepID=A0ABD3X5S9_SINWO
MASTSRLSVSISSLLDSMGFSRHMIDFRINNTRCWDIIAALQDQASGCIITGGKADGTSQFEQGDIDTMLVNKSITVSSRHVNPPTPQHTMLNTDDRDVHPGYTWLRVAHHGDMDDVMKPSLILMARANSGRHFYLSSRVFNDIAQKYLRLLTPSSMQLQQIAGPSQPVFFKDIQTDLVSAFNHPDWPVHASQWFKRCRRHGWPPESVVRLIEHCGCHVVPKGFKGSPTENMEWCFSFAIHERSILQLFNLTQIHVYILLKIIAKDLKKTYPDFKNLVTSYTMKTVALWLVELHHAKEWDRVHLLDRLKDALHFLKSCVESQNLPAYFIPENNLYDGKISAGTSARLSHVLKECLSQGESCVLRFSSINEQLHTPNENYNWTEMANLIDHCCQDYLFMDLSEKHMLYSLTLIDSPDMLTHRTLTKGVSKIMNATLAYINIAKVKRSSISNIRKYELYRPLLHIAYLCTDTDRISGRVKFAGVLYVLGKTNEAINTLYSIKRQPLFDVRRKSHYRNIIRNGHCAEKTTSDYMEAVITRFGRENYVQKCISLDVRYVMEEIDIVPNDFKYELFHVPETILSSVGAFVDPDFLMYYLLYKCHTELGNKAEAQAAFISLNRITTQEWFDPYVEYREVAFNVLGLCYMERENYIKAYDCFCRAMSIRPYLLDETWSTSTPWHLAVLVFTLINR